MAKETTEDMFLTMTGQAQIGDTLKHKNFPIKGFVSGEYNNSKIMQFTTTIIGKNNKMAGINKRVEKEYYLFENMMHCKIVLFEKTIKWDLIKEIQ